MVGQFNSGETSSLVIRLLEFSQSRRLTLAKLYTPEEIDDGNLALDGRVHPNPLHPAADIEDRSKR